MMPNHDTGDEDAPRWLAMARAAVVDAGLMWRHPLVTDGHHDDWCYEWWHGDRKITAYASDRWARVLTVDGQAAIAIGGAGDEGRGPSMFIKAWRWLHGDRVARPGAAS